MSLTNLKSLKIGYVPYSQSLTLPGDRRRFAYYAKSRGIPFEIADPAKKYDIVILSERADLSVWLRYPHGKLVFDLIDSYLALPTLDIKSLLRGVAKFVFRQTRYPHLSYRKMIQQLCQQAAAVVCTTEEQVKDIAPYCCNTHIILDAQTMVMPNSIKTNYCSSQPFRIVWEGLPHTLATLDLIEPIVQEIALIHPVEWHIVTDLVAYRFLGVHGRIDTKNLIKKYKNSKMILHEWAEETCAEIIKGCDLAVIPLDVNDPFSAGKPENKLLLFWRMGMPVATSATPAYRRAMDNAGVDMYCVTEEDWKRKIIECIENETYRKEMATRGETFARLEYSDANLLRAWDEVFSSITA